MRFAEMTAPEIRAIDRGSALVVAPIAACEQHGPHLPVITDTILATAVAEGVERALADRVLLLPTLWLGASDHHLPFGGTLTASLPAYEQILVELLTPLLEDGFRFDRTGPTLIGMGSLNPAGFSTHASGVNGDGSVVVGFSKQLIGATNTQRAYIWRSSLPRSPSLREGPSPSHFSSRTSTASRSVPVARPRSI